MGSQYKGVHWHKPSGKWNVVVRSKDMKIKYGGSFIDELDAAKRVNQLCVELKIPEQNPGIGRMSHRQWQVIQRPLLGIKYLNKSLKFYMHADSKVALSTIENSPLLL